MLEEALIYLDMGWAVFPVHSVIEGRCSCGRPDCPVPGKHPLGQWAQFQHRLPARREVYDWFASMPDCNVGMVTGTVSSIVVVDVDNAAGMETFKSLGMKPTLEARTGGGGSHFYYSSQEAVPSRIKVRDGIDIRGEGGFVVLPPSRHKSGKYYRWRQPYGLAPYEPELLVPLRLSGIGSNGNGWANELLMGVEQGARNVSAAKLAGRYAGMGLSLDEVWLLMTGWNERNSPPLEPIDLRRTVTAIVRKQQQAEPVLIETLGQILGLLKGEENGNKYHV